MWIKNVSNAEQWDRHSYLYLTLPDSQRVGVHGTYHMVLIFHRSKNYRSWHSFINILSIPTRVGLPGVVSIWQCTYARIYFWNLPFHGAKFLWFDANQRKPQKLCSSKIMQSQKLLLLNICGSKMCQMQNNGTGTRISTWRCLIPKGLESMGLTIWCLYFIGQKITVLDIVSLTFSAYPHV